MTVLYRFALLAYPRAFRRDFGDAVIDMFGVQRQRAQARGGLAVLAFWRFAFATRWQSARATGAATRSQSAPISLLNLPATRKKPCTTSSAKSATPSVA